MIEGRRNWSLAVAATFAIVAIAILLLQGTSGGGPSASPSLAASISPATASPSGAPRSTPTPTASGSASGQPTSAPASGGAPTPTPASTIIGIDASGDWSGTWTNAQPDTASGGLRMTLAQTGTALEGTVVLEGNACATDGTIQGNVVGPAVELRLVRRDEVEFVGTIDGDTMSGTFTSACDSSTGTWQVHRGG